MPITVDSRRKKAATLEKAHPNARLIDVTSRADQPWVRFSPFYPHGQLPVPFTDHRHGQSVEGIWQGLKVFEHADVDPSKFDVTSMTGLKRTVRRFGRVRGHRRGLNGSELLNYLEARWTIYLPTYRCVLENRLTELTDSLQVLAQQQPVVLLDYETNGNVTDLSRPLSHAWLIAYFIDNRWPNRDDN